MAKHPAEKMHIRACVSGTHPAGGADEDDKLLVLRVHRWDGLHLWNGKTPGMRSWVFVWWARQAASSAHNARKRAAAAQHKAVSWAWEDTHHLRLKLLRVGHRLPEAALSLASVHLRREASSSAIVIAKYQRQ
jgi:hypothetical protein